jgi:predicted RNase H-like HicB family nuclease
VTPVSAKAERVSVPTAGPVSFEEASAADLRREVETLEAEVERLGDQLANQEFHLLDGYVVAVTPIGDGTYIASCPTLHASVQEEGLEATLTSLRDAIEVVKGAHEASGKPLPPKDVVARCLD